MSAFAERMIAAALIAVTIVATAETAMAQWTVSLPEGRGSTDFSPHFPHFGPLQAPSPNPLGPSKTIVIPEPRPKHYAPNVLILPRTSNP